MEIKVLGTGCAKCEQLYETTRAAVEQSGLDPGLVVKVADIDEILAHGVMMTPALVIDGEVKSTGKVPDAAQIAAWVGEAAG
ncbi:MAG: TM0996/MTH895 family glutaredoxin-like protein [Actinobacteria bacterium]|nr:TM0996/MTH895 family glutaredoxin-like protein [Actinomycetota bacterium]